MHPIQCKCGTIRGQVVGSGTCNRVVCHCTDCQAFARFLGRQDEMLDVHGGTEVVQIAQPRLHISSGKEHLAAVRLSKRGLVRWYAGCCRTPIGNTMLNPKWCFVGVIHSALDRRRMDADFGTRVARVNTSTAIGAPKPKAAGLVGLVLRFLWIILSTRIGGRYRKSELFDDSGSPIASPVVLAPEELARFKRAP